MYRLLEARVRLLVHANTDVDAGLQVRAHGIFLGGGMVYAGLGIKPLEWLDIEPSFGFDATNNEAIAGIFVTTSVDKFWGWYDFEYQPQSHSGYYFAQLQYVLMPWLHVGGEVEGWGDMRDGETWSHGAGPNLLFRFGDKAGMDLVYQIRDMDHTLGGQIFIRFHIFIH